MMADTEQKPRGVDGMDEDEQINMRLHGEWICPVCGPTTVAPVDLPIVNDVDGSDVSPPHCVTCGTAIQPNIPLVDVHADRTHGLIDQVRHQESNIGLRDSFTFALVEKEDDAR